MEIDSYLRNSKYECQEIINNVSEQRLKDILNNYYEKIIETIGVKDANTYITNITVDHTTYAQGDIFPTPQDDIDRQNLYAETILEQLIQADIK